MSEKETEQIMNRFQSLVKAVWALVVLGFGAGAWAATLESRVRSLEKDFDATSQRLGKIERNLVRIGTKLNISDLETP